MTSIKVRFRESTIPGQYGTIFYQIIHRRKAKIISTPFHITPNEWDAKRERIRVGNDCCRNSVLEKIHFHINMDIRRLSRLCKNLDEGASYYTADDIVDCYHSYITRYSLVNYMRSVIEKLESNGRLGTAASYKSTLRSFTSFLESSDSNQYTLDKNDIMLDCITQGTMEAYQTWLKQRSVTQNTISFYTRNLRAVYNRAVAEQAIDDKQPFTHVYTGVDKTVKRALPISIIRKIKNLQLDRSPALDFARDLFILSFCLRGMSFIDMAFLKKSNLKNGYITYRRHKTGQLLVIKWTKEMQTILDKYKDNDREYLFPILSNVDTGRNEAETRRIYKNIGNNVCRALKKIGKMLQLNIPLTLYVARHSWASAARAKGIPVNIISEGMGHDSETTTQIYLASLDTSAVDRANSKILSDL